MTLSTEELNRPDEQVRTDSSNLKHQQHHTTSHLGDEQKQKTPSNKAKDHKEIEKIEGENEEQGGLFMPQFINNVLSFKEDILGQPGQDGEIRSPNPNDHDDDYATVPLPPVQGDQNIAPDEPIIAPPSTTPTKPPVYGPAVNPNISSEKDDVDTPTWLRKLQGYSLQNSEPNSNRWKDFKHAFKFGKNKKDQNESPQQMQQRRSPDDDSDEQTRMIASNLITSFISGSPAALFAASTFSTDEHGTRRAPIMLTMVGLKVEDISSSNSRNRKYKLNLEYGVGPNRLEWTVVKDLRDFVSLHSRLKVALFQVKNFKGQKNVSLPKFPKDAHVHEDTQINTLNDKYLSVTLDKGELPSYNLRNRQSSPTSQRSAVSVQSDNSSMLSGGIMERFQSIVSKGHHFGAEEEDQVKIEIYTKKLEDYLKQLIMVLVLRPQANRLFQFFELSPIGVLLSYESGFQGKQGYLIIGSSAKAQGWRVGHLKVSDLTQMVQRHTNKWFLVRSSYIMYVSDIYSTTPLEIFLVDPSFKLTYSGLISQSDDNDSLYDDAASLLDAPHGGSKKIHTHFTIKLENNERSLKVIARSENQARLWVKSIESMVKSTVWSKPNRFGSFAPIREHCFAQWFVDGRDHFWAISSAMEMAKDVIYIHDWWLSPELYMRRPANGNQEWRLDRILKRKAEQGVKIFVIIYRNVGSTVMTDSLWTKHSLIDLHPNIHVIRSPNQWLQNTYFWAHHEKICIIDHTVAFVGGLDLCYGRYDTPDHVLVDDSPHDFATKQNATEESIKYQKFPGKDYSNPRVKDFDALDKPYDSMYDREAVPRMPWHDVHMMTAGQPATDLARHFVQRWNYALRQKRPSRPTPLLTPPPDFNEADLERFNLSGTCEVQIVRSACDWSLGLQKHEQSIHDAYLKLIETSEHFAYMENQFFVTSCAFDGIVVENRIGDALVDRIIRAHNENKQWKAVIIIPLMPGFESEVDEAEGSAVRVIMQCQFMSISRGETSIFAKLKKMKINPYDYIQFFSLRKWGRIGPHRKVVSEQLYIHSKILIVDDRVALIGSANINERSQRGNRDSEVAAVVRDTEVVNTTMDDKPYKAGKFAHTLRMRLMREHLGVDVDILDAVERRFAKLENLAVGLDSKTNNFTTKEREVASSKVELAARDVLNLPNGTNKWKSFNNDQNGSSSKSAPLNPIHEEIKAKDFPPQFYHSFNNRAREENIGIRDNKQYSSDSRLVNNLAHRQDVDGKGTDRMESKEYTGYKLDAARTLKKWSKESLVNEKTEIFLPNVEQVLEFLEDDSFIENTEALTSQEEMVLAERNQERWELLKRIAYLQRVAAKEKIHNNEETEKLRKIGISGVSTKSGLSLNAEKSEDKSSPSPTSRNRNGTEPAIGAEIQDLPGDNIPVVNLDSAGINDFLQMVNDNGTPAKYHKFIDPYIFSDPISESFYEDVWLDNAVRNTLIFREVFHCQPDNAVQSWKDYKDFSRLSTAFTLAQDQEATRREPFVDSHSSTTTTDEEGPSNPRIPLNRRESVRVQDIEETNPLDGILGRAPPTSTALDEESADSIEGPEEVATNVRTSTGRRTRRGYGINKSSLGAERVFDRETADRVASEIQGHLVVFPVDWLSKEIESGNWFYNMDRLPPIEIYD